MPDTWYAVVDGAGNLVSTGTSVADPTTLAEQGYTAITLPLDPTGRVWDVPSRTFKPAPAKPTILTPWQFVQRFTPTEFAAIESDPDPIVRQFMLMLQVAGTVIVADAVVQNGLAYLVSAGLLTSSRASVIGT